MGHKSYCFYPSEPCDCGEDRPDNAYKPMRGYVTVGTRNKLSRAAKGAPRDDKGRFVRKERTDG